MKTFSTPQSRTATPTTSSTHELSPSPQQNAFRSSSSSSSLEKFVEIENQRKIRLSAEKNYIRLFRLISIKDPFLDRISLLACANQGLDANTYDLLPTPELDTFAADFYSKNKNLLTHSNSKTNFMSLMQKGSGSSTPVKSRCNSGTVSPASDPHPSTIAVGTPAYGRRSAEGKKNNNNNNRSPSNGSISPSRRPKREAFDPHFAAAHAYNTYNNNTSPTTPNANEKNKGDGETRDPRQNNKKRGVSPTFVRSSSSSSSNIINNNNDKLNRSCNNSPPIPSLALEDGAAFVGESGDDGNPFDGKDIDGKDNKTQGKKNNNNNNNNNVHEDVSNNRDSRDDSLQQNNKETLRHRESLLQRLRQDTILVTAHEMKIKQQAINIRIVTKERHRLAEIILRHMSDRMEHESLENEMMRLPKRMRAVVPSILLTHEENLLHAQLTAQETRDQKQQRQHLLELRRAMLTGEGVLDDEAAESVGAGRRGGAAGEDVGLDVGIEEYVRWVEARQGGEEKEKDETTAATATKSGKIKEEDDLDDSQIQRQQQNKSGRSSSSSSSPPVKRRGHFCRDPIERHAVRTLLNVQSSFQDAEAQFEADMAKITLKNQEKIEQVRRRQINTMMSEVNRIQQREDLMNDLAEREAVWRTIDEERKKELREKVLAADLARSQKLAKHEAEAERLEAERRAEVERNISRRNERIAQIEADKIADQKRRLQELEKAAEENAKRNEERAKELAAKAQLLGKETETKMALHGARKQNLTTRRDVMLTTQSQQTSKKAEEAIVMREEKAEALAANLDEYLAAKTDVSSKRKERLSKSRLEFFRRQNEEDERRRAEAEARREDFELFRGEWCEAVDDRRTDRNQYVEALAKAREAHYRLQRDITQLREAAHADAVERIQRVDAYTMRVKKAAAEAQEAHNNLRRDAARRNREQLRKNRADMSYRQELVQSAIRTMIDENKFPTDKASLERTIEELTPENQRRKRQEQNARRELSKAREQQQLRNSYIGRTSSSQGSSPSPTPSLAPAGRNAGGASSPVAAPPSGLVGGGGDGSTASSAPMHYLASSPVDEIIKRIRRTR